jgi:hypothetical protein
VHIVGYFYYLTTPYQPFLINGPYFVYTYPHYRNMVYYYPKHLRKLCKLCEVKMRKERIEFRVVMSVRGRAYRKGRPGVKCELSVRESSVRNEIVKTHETTPVAGHKTVGVSYLHGVGAEHVQ